MKTLRGVIHGRAIELQEDSGLPEGQEVSVTVEPLNGSLEVECNAFETLKRAAGSWQDDPKGLEEFLEWTREQRKVNRQLHFADNAHES